MSKGEKKEREANQETDSFNYREQTYGYQRGGGKGGWGLRRALLMSTGYVSDEPLNSTPVTIIHCVFTN